MLYIGGVFTGAGKISFTCCDSNLGWVIDSTKYAWVGFREKDVEARFFVAPLADGKIPVLDPATLDDSCKGGCSGC